jgi:hypothetical protein
VVYDSGGVLEALIDVENLSSEGPLPNGAA